MNKKIQTNITLKEFIIGFGFVEGLWLTVGINPKAEISKALIQLLINLRIESGYIFLFKILPILVLIGTLWSIYNLSKLYGLIVVFLAFIGGLLILVSPIFSIILLVILLILGKYENEIKKIFKKQD